jgi:hypothetical protein
LSRIYAHDANGWIKGDAEIHNIVSAEGYHQGDCLASWLFCLTIHPLLQRLVAVVGEETFIKFFIDDGNIAARHDTMLQIIDIILAEGPRYGFKLKLNKGTYLIGRCATEDEARMKKAQLIERYGFDESMIRIHPDNGGDPEQYGGKILGSFIGTDEYCKAMLTKKMIKLQEEAEAIIERVDSKQTRFMILKWSFAQKFIYWQRTMPPNQTLHVVPTFVKMKHEILSSVLGCDLTEIDDFICLLTYLQIKEGGIGLMNTADVSRCAYLASFAESSIIVKQAIGNVDPTLHHADLPSMIAFEDSLRYIFNETDNEVSLQRMINQLENIQSSTQEETLQHWLSSLFYPVYQRKLRQQLTTPAQVAWNTSVSNLDSGLWLDVAPKTDMHRFSNAQFEIALHLRLFMPQKRILSNRIALKLQLLIGSIVFPNYLKGILNQQADWRLVI